MTCVAAGRLLFVLLALPSETARLKAFLLEWWSDVALTAAGGKL